MSSEPASAEGPAPVRLHRPKTQLFRALSLLGCFPSLGALVILGLNLEVWRAADSLGAALARTRLEQWIALVLLLLHVLVLVLARRYQRVEKPVEIPLEKIQ